MKRKSKFFIVFPRKLVNEITWPDAWGYQCAGSLPDMLRDVLKVKSIGSEFKVIWNEQHRWSLVKDLDITIKDLEDYLKADCSMLSFVSERTMKLAAKELTDRGSSDFICVDNYRDVIMQQAFYRQNKSFNHPTTL